LKDPPFKVNFKTEFIIPNINSKSCGPHRDHVLEIAFGALIALSMS